MTEEHDGVEMDARALTPDEQAAADRVLEHVVELSGEECDEDEAGEIGSAFEPSDPTMLLGEMRDHVLGAVRRTSVWKGLDEKAKRDLANEVEQASRQVVKGAVRIAAGMGLDAIEVTISKPTLTDKRQIEAKILCPYEAKSWAAMPEHGKRTLVFADAETLMGARAVAVEKDQPGLFDDETPEQRATREAIDFEVAEREASIARARQFKPLDDTTTAGGEAAKLVGSLLPPAIKAAADRGRALRLDGGACKIPKDLEGKPSEVNAFLKAWEAADREAGAMDSEAPASEAAEPAKAPRGHRGKRTTAEERTAMRLASVEA